MTKNFDNPSTLGTHVVTSIGGCSGGIYNANLVAQMGAWNVSSNI